MLCRRVLLQKCLKEQTSKLTEPTVRREAPFPCEGALRACPSVVLACTRRTMRSVNLQGPSERPAMPAISIFCGCTFDAHDSTKSWPPVCIWSATLLFRRVYVSRHRPTVAACAERLLPVCNLFDAPASRGYVLGSAQVVEGHAAGASAGPAGRVPNTHSPTRRVPIVPVCPVPVVPVVCPVSGVRPVSQVCVCT